MQSTLEQVSRTCGDMIMEHYGSVQVEYKEDNSPITCADKISHHFLSKALKKIKNIPICSEEQPFDYITRKKWEQFWLVDPLDGTKEFINQTDEFCISIALIEHHKPIVGALYAPALNEFYYAEQGRGFSYIGPARKSVKREHIIVGVSRFHNSEMTKNFIKKNNFKHTLSIGSAIKFGRLALGELDIYPRFEGSSEWDIAAGALIIEEAKGMIIDTTTKKSPLYNKPSLRNNFFIAINSNVNASILKI